MIVKDFYELLNSELETEIVNSEDPIFKRYKQDQQKKSYALLIWFLKFYGQTISVKEFITDGDGDSSCDIIFSKTDTYNKKIFYIVQSKWNNKNNCESMFSATELKYTLNDFETILRGDKKSTTNDKFNLKYQELKKHLESNGEVKFIFLSLCKSNPSCEDNIQSFIKTYGPNISLNVIDINKIKRDYIEYKFKGLSSTNPLEYKYNPEESKITLQIERFGNKHDRDLIDFNGLNRAYIFIIKPKTIYELFEQYKLGLFYKNVRNPLISSSYNKEIKETLEKRPGSFWYFNNGITAITKLIPEIGIGAKQVEITGLQIINGAQTVYSIYLAYKEANNIQREIMDTDARITMRLIRSSDENFNFSITKYTNSQNEVRAFDFMSNDEQQIRIQNESFSTNFWYQRRRGEFIQEDIPENISIISNFNIATAYVAFHLQNPHDAIENRNLFFVSQLNNTDGLYEKIFNDNTKYEDMLASFRIYFLIQHGYKNFDDETRKKGLIKPRRSLILCMVSLTKVYLEIFLKEKYGDKSGVNLSKYINKAFDEEDEEKLAIIYRITVVANDNLGISNDFDSTYGKLLDSNNFYIRTADELRENGVNDEVLEFIENGDDEATEVATTAE
ncbi:AIPR family protein [Paenibacillus sp. 2TAF8]|uniref:AIPR family protein n=1 Tax=Paenibacillus sp. 2TAF8 TaxID=3233020 RepID=UPI003F9D852D